MNRFEERILADIGIVVRDNKGNPIPPEVALANFELQWPKLSGDQKIVVAMIILAIYRKYCE